MNHYLKSVSMKNSIFQQSNEVKQRNDKIPTYYLYNYGKIEIENIEYEDIVFTLNIPCMCAWKTEEYPIISSTFCMLIPSYLNISNNTFFWDIFIDNLNKIMFEFQIKHCEMKGKTKDGYQFLVNSITMCINHFDEYLLSLMNPIKKRKIKEIPFIPSIEFIQKIISNHLINYYTLIVSDTPSYSHFIYDLLSPLNIPKIFNKPNTQPTNQKILSSPNPFFTTISITSFTEDDYFLLPYPFCVINPIDQTVGRSVTQSLYKYFIQRQNYFISKACEILNFNNFTPTFKIRRELINPPLTSLGFDESSVIVSLLQQQKWNSVEMMLFKFQELCVMKSLLIFQNFISSHSNYITENNSTLNENMVTPQQLVDFQRLINSDTEGLKIIISCYKYIQPSFVGLFMDMIEKILNPLRNN